MWLNCKVIKKQHTVISLLTPKWLNLWKVLHPFNKLCVCVCVCVCSNYVSCHLLIFDPGPICTPQKTQIDQKVIIVFTGNWKEIGPWFWCQPPGVKLESKLCQNFRFWVRSAYVLWNIDLNSFYLAPPKKIFQICQSPLPLSIYVWRNKIFYFQQWNKNTFECWNMNIQLQNLKIKGELLFF